MLTKLLIDKAKPVTKPRRLADGRGMYLEIAPSGVGGGGSSTVLTERSGEFPWASIPRWAWPRLVKDES
jgi:hypothetical protein